MRETNKTSVSRIILPTSINAATAVSEAHRMSTPATLIQGALNPWVTFGYEVTMLRRLLEWLGPKNHELKRMPEEIQNAVTESAILHARQLADVLLSKGTEAADIRLDRLLPGFQPTRLGALRAAYGNRNSGGICQTFNQFAMHPTTRRGKSYNYSAELQRLQPIILDIVGEIEHTHGRAEDWQGL
jgi:hypothetical protein